MKTLISLAKKYHNRSTEFNRTQFLNEFNKLNNDDQEKAVAKGSRLSFILVGWCAATRMEIEEELGV